MRCQVYGQACPGYARTHKFNDETRRLQRRYVQDGGSSSSHSGAGIVTFSIDHMTPVNRESQSPEVIGPAGVKRLLNNIATDSQDIPALVPQSPELQQSQLLAKLLTSVKFDKSLPGDCFFFDTWLSQLPSKYGDSSTLDAAVRTLSLHHAGYFENSMQLLSESNIQYGRALRLMARDLTLANSKKMQSPDLLCATLICVLYEYYAHTTRDAWVQHALGAARLIRIQNLSPSQSPFLKTLFLVFRSVLLHACSLNLCLPELSYGATLHTLIRKNDCFMDDDEWRRTMSSSSEYGVDSTDRFVLSDQFNMILIKLPGLINEAKASYGTADGSAGRARNQLLNAKRNLQLWYERLKKVGEPREEVPSGFRDALYPTVYKYENIHKAALNSNYFMCILAINRALSSLAGCEDLRKENGGFVNDICMSVEYCMREGLRPPFQIIFALMIAFHSTTNYSIREFLTWSVLQLSAIMGLSEARKNSMLAILNRGPDRLEISS
ncbi:MAG: hypothetical protein M1818_006617 [Claussenomyces sp. TS43310]|nr:MAG: hypothetical protein M1818_006948 [Claussenomyces sp. TS43310]KAI9735040.1 MAG: hypothetical protein M1818_006617 [Claussenomyces sp. TS43310]